DDPSGAAEPLTRPPVVPPCGGAFPRRGIQSSKERTMNRDQAKGRMKEAMGKVQEKAGRATGSLKNQVKGLGKEAGGKIQKTVGDARNDAEKKRDREV